MIRTVIAAHRRSLRRPIPDLVDQIELPGGQPAGRHGESEALGIGADRRFALSAIGAVDSDTEHSTRRARRIREHAAEKDDPGVSLFGQSTRTSLRSGTRPLAEGIELGRCARPILRIYRGEQDRVQVRPRRRLQSNDAKHLRRPLHAAGDEVAFPGADAAGFLGKPQVLFAAAGNQTIRL